MSSSPEHISHALPAAVAALQDTDDLARQAAALDPTNPSALHDWSMRLRQMSRYPEGVQEFRNLLQEIRRRRNTKAARLAGHTDRIYRPAAWLNAQTIKWIQTAEFERRTRTRRPI